MHRGDRKPCERLSRFHSPVKARFPADFLWLEKSVKSLEKQKKQDLVRQASERLPAAACRDPGYRSGLFQKARAGTAWRSDAYPAPDR